MSTLEEKLHEWVIQEMNVLSDGRLKQILEPSSFRCATEGKKNKKIWKYVVSQVRSRSTAQKIKNILMLKRRQDDEREDYAPPITDTAIDNTRQEIKKAEEKRAFLEKSLYVGKDEILTLEKDVVKIKEEVSVINQKSAVLQLVALQYQEKISFLKYLNTELSAYLCEKRPKAEVPFYLTLYNSNAVIYPQTSNSVFGDGSNGKIKCQLHEVTSVVTKKMKKFQDVEFLVEAMKRKVEDASTLISMPGLLLNLKDQAKTSHMDLMLKETYSSFKFLNEVDLGDSKKILRQMKLDHIQSTFAAQRTKAKISKLSQEKDLMLKINEKTSGSMEDQKKIELLFQMAENEGLRASILYSENALRAEKLEIKRLNENNQKHLVSLNNLEGAMSRFYKEFDTLCMLLNSGPKMLEFILKYFSNLYKFANERVFTCVNPTIHEYPFQMKSDLAKEIEGMWDVFRKSGVIKPLMQDPLSGEVSVPDALEKMVDKMPFQSLNMIPTNVMFIKKELSLNPKVRFRYEEDRASNVPSKCSEMVTMLQKMQNHLHECSENTNNTVECVERVKIVLDDWWQQQAQYIPVIEYGGKTLKMWQDILIHLDGQ